MRVFHLKKDFLIVLLVLLMLSLIVLIVYSTARKTAMDTVFSFPLYNHTVVIDPGHGGYDPGVHRDGVTEKDIVLDISRNLKLFLRRQGAEVIMTREVDKDLLEVGPKKRKDLEGRMKVIEKADADLLVSVHTNAMESPVWSGAQTFFSSHDDQASRQLALCVQEELVKNLGNTKREAKPGYYYILEQSPIPATIVEVGFISNPEEAEQLKNPDYQKKVALSIYKGIYRYFMQNKTDL